MSRTETITETINVEALEGFWAYDYEKQEWVQGVPALHLLVKQTQAELEILISDGGPEYWNSIKGKSGKSCHDYVMRLEELLITYLDCLCSLPTGEYMN